MQDLRITLVQADQKWEDKKANFNNYETLLENVDTDLILLPEMFQTGFTMKSRELGESWIESESVRWLHDLARKKQSAIYTSLIIEEGGKYYNRGVFIEPNSLIHHYDKRKTFTLAKEDKYYSNGQTETIVQYRGWNIQLQICYDLRFPEIVRNELSSNQLPKYDVILYVANWPEKRSEHWKALLKARAIENQCFVAAVNRVGSDENGLSYTGDSGLIDALGKEQTVAPGKETAETYVINMNQLYEIREMLPFLKDR
jgi:predicted amidohydrolase